MVASRKKKLDNRLGMEKNAAGHRLKINKDFVGYFDSARQMGGCLSLVVFSREGRGGRGVDGFDSTRQMAVMGRALDSRVVGHPLLLVGCCPAVLSGPDP